MTQLTLRQIEILKLLSDCTTTQLPEEYFHKWQQIDRDWLQQSNLVYKDSYNYFRIDIYLVLQLLKEATS